MMKIKAGVIYSAIMGVVFVLLSEKSKAAEGDIWTNFTLHSYHFDRDKKHNEKNYGAGLSYYIKDKTAIQFGEYYNSNWHHSVYAGLSQVLQKWDNGWNISLMGGFVNGYSEKDRDLFNPYVLLTAGYEGKRFGFDVGLTSQVIGVAFKIKVDLK